ncbi:uncharacterized protein F4807DRAFT_464348 [Annulohypoxylon truncatum]|uniref:uncharacterized protein n=1 Tax=Annulohypoxylon truncatum TaxID=327061 RepID=UPI00200822B1|nr:uncharacterized protein F4807DRAFT_464348 [Annulohypoxylon truncatum]KAI1205886.1 hypothetical protein F4807DRAFT_464348 [Annulohypoxylon truncatum]
MEHVLRCNALKCRKELGDRALVTTCSHIFCLDCAARLGLTSQGHEPHNSCPACGSRLTSPDDAVISNLNPSEDYKTSVLSGLSPNIIIECASRALSFWAYQATQEVVYQEHLSKALTEKYSNLSVHLDKVINEANLEITSLQNKLTGMRMEQDSLRRKNEELTQAYKEKSRKLLQIQELYDKLKRKAMLGQIQDAAEDAIDSTLHGSPAGRAQFESGGQNPTGYEEIGTPYGRQHHPAFHEQRMMPVGYQHQTTTQDHGSSWPRTMGAQLNVPVTPSTHRQRIGENTGMSLSNIPGLVAGTPQTQHNRINMRPPQVPQGEGLSSSIQGNPRFPPVGLSSGLKVSHGGGNPDRLASSSARPRVARRPSPVSSTFNRRPVGGQQENMLGGVRGGFTNL